MRPLAAMALALLSGAASATAPAIHSERIVLFTFFEWTFSCHVDGDTLSRCDAEKSFGDVGVKLEEIRDGVAVSVRGGCPASGEETTDAIEETFLGARYSANRLRVRRVAADRVNARRAACGQPRISEREVELIEMASILFIEITN